MTLPRLIILTTERELFRLANSERVKEVADTLGNHYNVLAVTDLSEALIASIKHDDVLFVRSKDRYQNGKALKLEGRCKVMAENLTALISDDSKETFKIICNVVNCHAPKSFYDFSALEFPVFVKPASLGDSIGVDEKSVCFTKKEVQAKCDEILHDYHAVPMVEQYIKGREFTVAILRTKNGDFKAALELRTDEDSLTFKVKQEDTETQVPVDAPMLLELATRIADEIGVSRMCRMDFICDKQGRYFALEVNVLPGLGSKGYMFHALSAKYGWNYKEFLEKILEG